MSSTVEKIRAFKSLQESRVREHKTLNSAFKLYLSSGPDYDFPSFQKAVGEATKKFQEISEKIIGISKSCDSEVEEGDLRAYIENVQELEGRKLKTTVEYQLLSQKARDDPEDHHVLGAKAREMAKSMHATNQEIMDIMEEVRYLLADLEEES